MNLINKTLIKNFYKSNKNLQNGVIICFSRNKWTFRTNLEAVPITEPKKIRFDIGYFSTPKLSQKYFAPRLSRYTKLIAFCTGFGLVAYYMTPEDKNDSISFDKELETAPERIKKYFTAKAASIKSNEDESSDADNANVSIEESDNNSKKKERLGFRDSRVIAYEDRIRAFSTPDKIFRYFGTIQDTHNEIYMTPNDFVRSITPGVKQPDGLGLDCFRKIDIRKERIKNDVPKDSVFYMFGENALLNFSDYVFLLSVLSTPPRQFEIAFRMFDLNGDGELDIQEFEVVRSVIHSGTPIGKRHRDNNVTGNTLNVNVNSSLSKFFFGNDGTKKLTIKEFLKFQADLQHEIMRLEFDRYNPENDRISEVDFADALLMYAGFSENKKKKFIRRVKQKYDGENAKGISFDDYVNFSRLLQSIADVDTALTFYHLAGASIDPQMLKHVSKAVSDVDLDDHLIDVVFVLFDENNDYHLSNKEFISVMKQRLLRGLDKPMDTGFVRMLTAMAKCGKRVLLE